MGGLGELLENLLTSLGLHDLGQTLENLLDGSDDDD